MNFEVVLYLFVVFTQNPISDTQASLRWCGRSVYSRISYLCIVYIPIRSKTLSFDTNDGFLEYSTMYFEMIFLRKLISLASFRIVKTVLEIIVNSVHLEFI